MSAESTLTSKGQTTIPKNIRERLNMKTGETSIGELVAVLAAALKQSQASA